MKRILSKLLAAFLISGRKIAIVSAVIFTSVPALSESDYDVKFYHLNLNVSDSSTYLEGSVAITIKSVILSLQHVTFDMSSKLVVDSILTDHQRLSYDHHLNELNVDLFDPVAAGNSVNINIYYHGLGKYSGVTSGIYNKFNSTWNKHITWTLSEPFSAMYWFPCKQSVTDKADSVYVFLSTDGNRKVGSNGLLTAVVPLPDNRIRYEWKSRYPIDYYLISFTVSDYMDYSFYAKNKDENDSILIQNYIYNDSNYLNQNKAAIDKTADLIWLYSDLFGVYPFKDEKYGHCVAPFSGGMEHQTMTTLVTFSFLLVAHELSHQWFGDYVTCKTWQDIWINEGFASYAEYLANQYLLSQSDADLWLTSCNNFVKSGSGGSVFVPETSAENENRIFDSRLSYKKGASIIHMIRQEVGNDALFFSMLSTFLSKYGNSNASGIDLKNHIEEVTGKDFDQFFNQWYFSQGYPIHSISWDQRNNILYINSLQTVSSETPFFNVLIEFNVKVDNKDTLIAFRQTSNFNKWEIHLPGNVSSVQADPNHWLLIDLSDINLVSGTGNDSGFTILPNPANDKVKINFDEPVTKYSIFLINNEGRIVLQRQSSLQQEEIDVHSYPSGVYFIIIKTGKTSLRGKFVIN